MIDKRTRLMTSLVAFFGLVALILWVPTMGIEYKTFDFEIPVSIRNNTSGTYNDSIVYLGLKKLGIDSVYVEIHESKEINHNFIEELDVRGGLIPGLKGSGQYLIKIVPLSKGKSIDVIAHELIHLQQHHEGRLMLLPNSVFYNGEMYSDLDTMEYGSRPWEVEARDKGLKLAKEIREIWRK